MRTCGTVHGGRRRSQLRNPYHQPHLQNFFDAIRGKGALLFRPRVGYDAVSVLKVNEAINTKCRLNINNVKV